jgi:hypothetical protein
MTYGEDRVDLLRHEKEMAAHQSFNYAVLGPPERIGSDGEVSRACRGSG